MRTRYLVNFGSVLGVTLTFALLVASAPTAAPALVNFAKQAERITVSRSHDSAVFDALRRGLAYGSSRYWRLNNKLSSKTTTKPGSYAPVAAVTIPAPVIVDAPTNLGVTSAANTSISLSWTAPAGSINNYQVERSQSVSGPFSVIGTPTATTFNDTTVSSGNAYLYRVRAVSGGIPSLPSNIAVGTAITFTDNPLTVGVTVIKAVHVTELRQSINAVRAVAGLSAASWTDTSLSGIFVKAVHVQEMRDRLGEALTALSVSITAYTDPVLATGASGTVVKKVHIEELRQRATGSSSTSSGSSGADLSIARLDPLNRTGSGGEDPLSRNFNWTIPLVNLRGRAALDLSLSLSYNSLVWTKTGSVISFDDDRGFPSAGFRLGFPVIQQLYLNSETGKWSYLLITQTGSRVELRQVGASPLYESADSSQLLLDTSTSPMILRTTDGTQFSYELKGNDFQCTKIKDRNGNFITVNYTAFNRIDTVVDTLSRSIKFNYDGSQSLTSITQTWTVNGSPVTHTWASFAYSNPNLTIQTNFPGLTVIGPANGSTIKVLSQVTTNDGTRFNFDYSSWGQVWKISNFAPAPNDSHLRNYRSYNLPLNNSTAHSDCPRFTQRKDLAANWNRSGPNGNANLPAGAEQEVVTTYAVPQSATWTMPDNSQQTGLQAQVTFADNTYNKIYFEGTAGTSSGWKRGLVSLVETFDSVNVRQKQTVTTWTQDNTAVSFPLNFRVTESNVYDPAGNRARTVTDYHTVNLPDGTTCRLPKDVFEYQANATTVLRRTHTEYKLTSEYTSRRIIGLVREKTLFEVDPNTLAETLSSKVVFEYDESGSIQGNDAPVQHDNTNYTSSFVAGRANLSSLTRHDVVTAQTVTSTTKYNTAGAMVQATDPSNHSITVSYADAFAANGTTLDPALGFSTLAYPTTVNDADGYTSSKRYHYDFGEPTWEQTPLPGTTVNTPGPQEKMTYDSVGRIERITNLVNNAYTRFIYGPNYIDTFATVNTVADEAHSLEVFDGLGRVIAAATNHPGSTGGFSGKLTQYDVMGLAIKQSNPTETSITISGVIQPYNWSATGDDTAFGWVYTQQTFDWKGRPRVTTHPDGATKEASYAGCGCAGGEVVTLTDEGTIFAGVAKKRQQKIYSDILGRTIKTEVLNWDGGGPFGTGGTVYAATVNSYNARDQITSMKQYAGAATIDGSCPSGTCQETTTTYDGHGRLKTRHVPEQNVGTNTVWDYNNDDTIQKITDARGASKTFAYNNRHLTTGITYAWPGGGTVPAPVTFGYDAAGNRTSVADGSGSCTYGFNQLSRITSETHNFSPLGLSGNFTLSYDYTLNGKLKSITDHTNQTVHYSYDNASRVNTVTGTNYIVNQFVNSTSYRASGVPEQISYGNGRSASWSYNARLQTTHFEIPTGGGFGPVLSVNYQYYNDGRVKYSQNLLDGRYDRSYEYDHASRLSKALSGAEARGEPNTNDRPYRETFSYDAFNHITVRSTKNWSKFPGFGSNDSYSNNRRIGWTYDADGNLTNDIKRQYTLDAAGRIIFISGGNMNQFFDGKDQRVKTLEPNWPTYYLRSAVLGEQVVAELDGTGVKRRGFIYVGSQIIAEQAQNGSITLKHEDPSKVHLRYTHAQFANQTAGMSELDPVGAEVYLEDPYLEDPEFDGTREGGLGSGNIGEPSTGCTLDGVFFPCDLALRLLSQGAAVDAPTRLTKYNFEQKRFEFFRAYADGFAGFLPMDAQYYGNGIAYSNAGLEGNLDELAGFISLDPSQEPPSKRDPIHWYDLAKIRFDLKKILARGRCKEFIRRVLERAGATGGDKPVYTDIIDLFDAVFSQRGFVSQKEMQSGRGFSSVDGAVGAPGGAEVRLSAGSEDFKKVNPALRIRYYAWDALSELTHVAGSKPSSYAQGAFSDYHLGKTALDVALEMGTGVPNQKLTLPTADPNNDPFGSWSGFYHDRVKDFCKRDF